MRQRAAYLSRPTLRRLDVVVCVLRAVTVLVDCDVAVLLGVAVAVLSVVVVLVDEDDAVTVLCVVTVLLDVVVAVLCVDTVLLVIVVAHRPCQSTRRTLPGRTPAELRTRFRTSTRLGLGWQSKGSLYTLVCTYSQYKNGQQHLGRSRCGAS